MKLIRCSIHLIQHLFKWQLLLMFSETNGDAIEEEPLDPRAGRVDVVMPVLEFDAKEIANIAEGIKYKKFTRAKNRKTLDRIINT